MLNVTDTTKNAYLSDRKKLNFTIQFPDLNLTYNNNRIVAESFRLQESLCDNDSVEFVGCIASMCQVTLYDVQDDVKNALMSVSVQADGVGQQSIPLFVGYVDSVEIQSERKYKKITAYDALYSASEKDVSAWYNALTFPITLGNFRKSLCTELNISYHYTETLPNDSVTIAKEYMPRSMNGLSMLKAVCQINGACGIIDRTGKLTYRYVSYAGDGLYPSSYTYPGATTFPGKGSHGDPNNYPLSFYETIKYQEFTVKPVDKVQIRKKEDDAGVVVGSGDNKYIIQANVLAYKLPDATLQTIAKNILKKLKHSSFHPFNAKNNGLPFLEVGDTITYAISDSSKVGSYNVNTFLIMSRTLQGTQFLRDNFTARGTENQSEFITDLRTQIDTIKQNGSGGIDPNDYYTKDDVDDILDNYPTATEVDTEIGTAISEMETPTGLTFASVYSLPNNPRANTLYGIQCGVIVVE